MEKLYSVEAAAEALGGISTWTIRRYLSTGKIKKCKVGGRTMIRESELEKLIIDDDSDADAQQ